MNLSHFYHIYADGKYQEPVREHFSALLQSGLAQQLPCVRIGVVGSPTNRTAAIALCCQSGIPIEVVGEADKGWEQVTMAPTIEWAAFHDGLILYAHTKGSFDVQPLTQTWRRSMTHHCVTHWETAVAAFDDPTVNLVGTHWLGDLEIIGGNFWWVRSTYLRDIPPLKYDTRYDAETLWKGHPRAPGVVDRFPGYPWQGLFDSQTLPPHHPIP